MPGLTPPPRAADAACFGPDAVRGAGAAPLHGTAVPSPGNSRGLLLDPLQTSSPDAVAVANWAFYRDYLEDWNQPFQHSGWAATRRRVFDAMEATDQPIARGQKFVGCGDETYVYENTDTGEVDFHGSSCGDRFCLICGQKRSRMIARSLATMIGKEQPLFITLTLQGKPGDSLTSMLDRLTDAWKQLRRLDHWRKKIRGGAIMLEVKYSTESGGHWHPHYHLMCHGSYIEKQWLQEAWKLITRDSFIVDIKRVDDLQGALGYVTKYASKPMDSSFTNRPHLLQEAMRTLKGRRLCACFGTWYGVPLNDKPEEFNELEEIFTPWRFAGTRRTLESKAADGDTHAKLLLSAVDRVAALRLAFDLRSRGNAAMRQTTGPPPDIAA